MGLQGRNTAPLPLPFPGFPLPSPHPPLGSPDLPQFSICLHSLMPLSSLPLAPFPSVAQPAHMGSPHPTSRYCPHGQCRQSQRIPRHADCFICSHYFPAQQMAARFALTGTPRGTRKSSPPLVDPRPCLAGWKGSATTLPAVGTGVGPVRLSSPWQRQHTTRRTLRVCMAPFPSPFEQPNLCLDETVRRRDLGRAEGDKGCRHGMASGLGVEKPDEEQQQRNKKDVSRRGMGGDSNTAWRGQGRAGKGREGEGRAGKGRGVQG